LPAFALPLGRNAVSAHADDTMNKLIAKHISRFTGTILLILDVGKNRLP
jgi:hypothetical protein